MIAPPATRRLKILAFDPSLSGQLETAGMNQITAGIQWESELQPGPIGEYIEVVDYDPASGVFYKPVDLNDPHLLAQDGISPSESNPQFHQQMVYAVAMTTIRHFERALGRVAFWSDRKFRANRGRIYDQFVRRLRIYPHALRDRNAYYSPEKKAVLFGYFPVAARDRHNTPGTIVYSCLSHDIIAHEVSHALLDGVHPRFNEPTNPDVHAFHEAFADIVALFQHFTYPSVLESQLSRTRGSLHTENLLSQLAQQFGRATGRGAALRDALGDSESGIWKPRDPDPHALNQTVGPHDRGAILVAAVFRAFLLIYRSKTADLFRIATGGTGTLPEGEIHPDLTRRLASEAARFADRVLQMCIRAIDYCPPVDITFGDFLRGIITADIDYNPEDESGFRTVFVQSFREWGIHPRGIRSMGIDTLAWPSGEALMQEIDTARTSQRRKQERKSRMREDFLKPRSDWSLQSDRFAAWKASYQQKAMLWTWLRDGDSYGRDYAKLFGLIIDSADAPPTVYRNEEGMPAIEVHSVRPTIRRTLWGGTLTDLVVEITQRRRGYFDPEEQKAKDSAKRPVPRGEDGDFRYRAGCTVLIDLATQEVRRVIRTPGTIADNEELERVRKFLCGDSASSGSANAFDAGLQPSLRSELAPIWNEPFALLHQGLED